MSPSLSQHCSVRLSTFISYETADKGLAGQRAAPSAGENARKGYGRWGSRRRGRDGGEEEEATGVGQGERLSRPARGAGTGGEDIIAGGLMRRHNCTIIDDRFIRRPGPGLTGTCPHPDRGHRSETRSHIIIRRSTRTPLSPRSRYAWLVRNDNYRRSS